MSTIAPERPRQDSGSSAALARSVDFRIKLFNRVCAGVLIALALIWLVPLAWTVDTALKPNAETTNPTWRIENPTLASFQTLLEQAAGDSPAALAALERALAIAAPEGLVRSFLDEGPAMVSLLTDYLRQSRSPSPYSRVLLAAFPVLWAGGGGHHTMFSATYEDLLRVTGGVAAAVA